MRKHFTPGVVLGVIAICIAMSGSAVAGSLITSAKIKDGTIQNKDIKKGTISVDRLTKGTQNAIQLAGVPGARGATGTSGANGATGATGAKGEDGAPGTTLLPSPGAAPLTSWGLINRNTEGAATAFLREGPLQPPYGSGSLNLLVGDSTQKVAFGNEVDGLRGSSFANVSQVGFQVYSTGENRARYAGNVPSIIFEVDPNMATVDATKPQPVNYTSLVFSPDDIPKALDNQWTSYLDGATTGHWGMTGGAFDGSKCDLDGTRCSLAELQTYLNDGGEAPKIISVSISKGKDYAFQGAVDGLRVNDTVFDFESDGVFTTTP